jgi:hypothetical protein
MAARLDRNPGPRHHLLEGRRPLRPGYFERLRGLIAVAGSLNTARLLLRCSPEVMNEASANGPIRESTAERFEAKLDELARAIAPKEAPAFPPDSDPDLGCAFTPPGPGPDA